MLYNNNILSNEKGKPLERVGRKDMDLLNTICSMVASPPNWVSFTSSIRGDVFLSFKKEGNIAKIVIADDHAIIRFLYKELLTEQGHVIIAETDNGFDALTSNFELSPDLIIIDNHMGLMNGIDVVREILQKDDNAKIIMCTASPHDIKNEAKLPN